MTRASNGGSSGKQENGGQQARDDGGGGGSIAAADSELAPAPHQTREQGDALADGEHVSPSAATVATTSSSTLRIEDDDLLRKRRKFTHTSEAQRLCMLEWLEQPRNFQLMTEKASTVVLTSASGKKLKKADGYRSLMRHVNLHTHAQWSIDVTRSRYESFIATFKKTQKLATQSDFEVTANDRVRGITDLSQKLNAMCLFYDRIDALFATGKPLAAHVVGEAAAMKKDDAEDGDDGVAEREGEEDSKVTEKQEGDDARVAETNDTVDELVRAGKRSRREVVGDRKSQESEEDDSIAEVQPLAGGCQDGDEGAAASSESEESAAQDGSTSSTQRTKRIKYRNLKKMSPVAHSKRHPLRRRSSIGLAAPTAANPFATTSSEADPLAVAQMSDEMMLKFLEMEREKLALQQEQLRVHKRELEIKEKEIEAQESMKKHTIRADLTSTLAQAGKTPSEIKEYLSLLG